MRPRIAISPAQLKRSCPTRLPLLRTATKKGSQRIGRRLWRGLRKEVAALEGLPLNVVAPLAPEGERSALLLIPSIERTSSAPQREDWAADATAASAIRHVMLAIDARSGP